jgi:hypothetical protein
LSEDLDTSSASYLQLGALAETPTTPSTVTYLQPSDDVPETGLTPRIQYLKPDDMAAENTRHTKYLRPDVISPQAARPQRVPFAVWAAER